MKIGILTQPLQDNYGGLLQAFALQYSLVKLGHEPYVLNICRMDDYRTLHNYLVKYNKTFRRLIKYVLGRTKISYFHEEWYDMTQKEVKKFVKDYINTTELIKSPKMLKSVFNQGGFDVIIVGSDQVWRPSYSPKIDNYFLDFCKKNNVGKYSYAASFGVDVWEYSLKQTNRCSTLIKQFDGVSVRESSGVALCEKYLNTKAIQVLDPTLLLDKDIYESIVIKNKTPKSTGDLFVYILDNNKTINDYVNIIEDKLGLRHFTTMPKRQLCNISNTHQLKDCIFPSVEQWIRSFIDADFVLTDSFHGCVFSIIFNKPFVVIGNLERGQARFKSLLSVFDLESRLCYSSEEIIKVIESPINWEEVDIIKNAEISKSLNYLSNIKSI